MHRTSIPLLFVLAAFLFLPLTSRAADLRYGDRVRVNTTGADGSATTVTGTVLSLDQEKLVVQTDRKHGDIRVHEPVTFEAATIPLNSVTSVDRAIGKETHTWEGALIGAAAGTGIGLLVWYAGEPSHSRATNLDQAFDNMAEDVAKPFNVVMLGLLGAGVGAVIGHHVGNVTWHSVDDLSLAVSPVSNAGTAVALNLNF